MTLPALENTKRFDRGFGTRVFGIPDFSRKIALGCSGRLNVDSALINFRKKSGKGFSKVPIHGFSIPLTVFVLSGEFPESLVSSDFHRWSRIPLRNFSVTFRTILPTLNIARPERIWKSFEKTRSVFAQFSQFLIKNDLEVLKLFWRLFRKTPTNDLNKKTMHSRQNANVTLGES
jgi:hypothetical protein